MQKFYSALVHLIVLLDHQICVKINKIWLITSVAIKEWSPEGTFVKRLHVYDMQTR